MQFGPHQDAERITRQLLALVEQAPVDEIMFFYFAEEMNDGHETLERIDEWIEHSRPYREALAAKGVLVSLNPWHSILHCDRGRRLKPGQAWQPMVDTHGRETAACVCPLDTNWRQYFAETLRRYALEGFRVIWIDEDIRLHNHEPLDWGGCFCPLHVTAFNERAGTSATRDEIVTACLAPGDPHPWREAWMDMWDETQCELVASWRRCVESEGAKLGLMTSSHEQHAAEGRRWANWWRAIADDGVPVVRPHFWSYGSVLGHRLPSSIALLDQSRSTFPEKIEFGPEVECFPYGAWNNSFRHVGARMALAQTMGATNLNISLLDFMGNDPEDEPERAAFLKRWRPVCDLIADEFSPNMQLVGVGVPWSEELGRRIHTDTQSGSDSWQALVGPSRRWANWLGGIGVSFSMRPSSAVNALSGAEVWGFDEDTLKQWLSRGILLDGAAAAVLVERGLGEYIGVRSAQFIQQNEVAYSVEQSLDADFGLREGAQMSVNWHPYAHQLFQGDLHESARIVSDLRTARQEAVGHGLVLFENDLGGRVAIVPWTADELVSMAINIQRSTQLRKVLAWLDPDHQRGMVSGAPWLIPQFLTDGSAWHGVIWNGNEDPVERIEIELPAGMPPPARVLQVTGHGDVLPAALNDGAIALDRPLQQWEFVVLL